MSKAPIELRTARLADTTTLASLMVEELDTRLSDLGPWFVKVLHRHMIASEHCIYLVAERSGEIIGYVAGLTSTKTFFQEFLLSRGLACFFVSLPWLLRPRNIHTALRGLTYSRRAPTDDPDAELISLVVSPTAWRSGVGTSLYRRLIADFQSQGINTFKIDTSTENEKANAFYLKHGCHCVRSEPFYRNTSINVYIHNNPSNCLPLEPTGSAQSDLPQA